MSNPNGAKGAKLERDGRGFLEEVFGRHVRRPRQEGFKDVGDLHLSPFVIQAKDYADTTAALHVGVNGAEIQAGHAGEDFGVALIKKRRANIAEARVAMTLRTFRRLAFRLRSAEAALFRADPDAFDKHLHESKEIA